MDASPRRIPSRRLLAEDEQGRILLEGVLSLGSSTGCRSHRYPWIRTCDLQVPVPTDRCGSATRTVRVRLSGTNGYPCDPFKIHTEAIHIVVLYFDFKYIFLP